MVNYRAADLDRTFAALSDPTRRALVARLGRQPGASVSALAGEFPISLQAVIKHLDVLADARLIARTKTGRTVACRLTPEPLGQLAAWLDVQRRTWDQRLDRLDAYLDRLQRGVSDDRET